MLNKVFWYSFLVFMVVGHIILILFHVFTFFLLIYLTIVGTVDWYIALPCCSWMFYTGFAKVECPLTTFENMAREKLGLRKIRGFFGHYFLKIPKQVLGIYKPKEDHVNKPQDILSNQSRLFNA